MQQKQIKRVKMHTYFIKKMSAFIKILFSKISLLIRAIILLAMFSLVFGIIVPHIYTPPALSQRKLKVYEKCIDFFAKYPEYKKISIHNYNDIIIEDKGRFFVDNQQFKEKLKKYFKETDIAIIKELSALLKKVGCSKAQKINNMILFYAHTYLILPDTPGVLYSSDKVNPNQVNDVFFNQYKPFVKINDYWYFSRALIVRWNRKDDDPISKSLFDRAASKYALE